MHTRRWLSVGSGRCGRRWPTPPLPSLLPARHALLHCLTLSVHRLVESSAPCRPHLAAQCLRGGHHWPLISTPAPIPPPSALYHQPTCPPNHTPICHPDDEIVAGDPGMEELYAWTPEGPVQRGPFGNAFGHFMAGPIYVSCPGSSLGRRRGKGVVNTVWMPGCTLGASVCLYPPPWGGCGVALLAVASHPFLSSRSLEEPHQSLTCLLSALLAAGLRC